MNNVIIVDTKEKILKINNGEEIIASDIFIGRNGVTNSKCEGDGKTPLGTFEIGIVFGCEERKNINLDASLEYIKINENLYWIDDVNSKHYNTLVDSRNVEIDWKTAEHLIELIPSYELAIEIKINPENIKGKGSAIFIHCSNQKPTAGCVAISKENMIELISKIDKNTRVIIK